MNDTVLECKNITKTYAGTKALDNVDFSVKKGHIHALLGENGAGKSTLSAVISGLQRQTSGEIYVEGNLVNIKNPAGAKSLGITIMTQEVDYCPNLTVAGNVFLGQEKKRRGTLDWKYMNAQTKKVLDKLQVDFKPTDKAENLSISQKQQMQLARVLYSETKLIIMDEPTSSLNDYEVDVLFQTLRLLKSENISVIYISHRMEEIFKIADIVTILRDGKRIGTRSIEEITPQEAISMIIGRDQKFTRFDRTVGVQDKFVLKVNNLSRKDNFQDVSFGLKKGEVLGFFGLRGSGTDSLIQSIFGLNKIDAGEVLINGKKVEISIQKAIANKMVFIPSNRREEGICKTMNIRDNVVIGSLRDVSRFCVINSKKSLKKTNEMIDKLQIDCKSAQQRIAHLSGGNQQKVVVARNMLMNADIILINNPTRGIDVGAKVEIYRIIHDLSEKGISVIITSSETTDIMSICDRVIVMQKGRIRGEFDYSEVDDERILGVAMN